MRISDWSSDVCSSDLGQAHRVIIATVRRTFWPNRNVTAWEFLLVEFMGHGSVSLQEVSFQKGAVHARELRHSRRMVARTPANLRFPASSLTRSCRISMPR